MPESLPPPNSLVCVDNTIIFKAIYNPFSVVTEVFSALILERSCTLYTTEKNFRRCQEAVQGKILKLIEKLLEERDPDKEQFKRYSFILEAIKIAQGRARKGRGAKKVNSEKVFRKFTEELMEQVEAFLEQRLEFVKSFLEVKDFSFYKENFQKAISLLEDRDQDHEDAHILALALALHNKHNVPVYLWTDDTDFYDVESILKGYGIIPFKRVRF